MLAGLTDVPLHRTPWVNLLLILGNVLAFIGQLLQPQLTGRFMLNAQGLHVHQFLTYAFLHISPGHLIFNMIVLWMLGHNLNDRLGHVGYLAFYLAAAIVAGIGFILAGGQAMVGASGAIGGVMGAYLVYLPRSHVHLPMWILRIEAPAMYFILLFFLYNVLMSFLGDIALQQVAYEAHIAGMLFGFFVAVLTLRLRLLPRGEVLKCGHPGT